jgi:hypothetical protein
MILFIIYYFYFYIGSQPEEFSIQKHAGEDVDSTLHAVPAATYIRYLTVGYSNYHPSDRRGFVLRLDSWLTTGQLHVAACP